MNVRELMKQLKRIHPDTEVYLWLDGSRIVLDSVDASFEDEGWIDINAQPEGEMK